MARISPSTTRDAAAFLKHPESIDDFLLFRLYKLSRLALHRVGLMLQREAGISQRDSRIMAYVSKLPGVSLTQLAQIAELDAVVTSRCVAADRCESKQVWVTLCLHRGGSLDQAKVVVAKQLSLIRRLDALF